ncbi:MAG: glycine betaine ABC transporter substrate-binding protein, partial [Halobacillus sp.]|uniref:glycine betaine ABC transporter substrate-binding protein n=1 Tax=Halobacillus sp. TaxID=56800 RepID=UPI003BB1A49E
MHKWKKELSFILAILMLAVLAACGSNSEEAESEQTGTESEAKNKELTIGQVNWAENIAVTNMWKVILEDKGYNFKLNNLNMGSNMKALE